MDKKQIFTFGAAGAFFMAFIMSLVKVFTVRASAYGMSFSESVGLGKAEAGFALVLLIILNLGGIAMTLLPEFNLIPKKPFYKWIVLGAAATALLIFIIAWIALAAKFHSEMGGSSLGIKASFGPSFGGWLLMIFEIGAGVLTYLKTMLNKE